MTDTPKRWKDMTDAEKAEVLLADHRNEELQGYCGYWVKKHNFFPYHANTAYRIKPEAPKVETVTRKVQLWDDEGTNRIYYGHYDDMGKIANITHTYTITDGIVTACDTIIHKNEE
jgi:hypothetical protein